MNNSVLIITDQKRNIEYSILNSFYTVTMVSKGQEAIETINLNKLIVIDVSSPKKILDHIHRIRKVSPEKSILVIESFGVNIGHEIIRQASGYGQLRIMNYRSDYPEQLVESVNELMHPQYPVVASEVAIILPVYNEESRFQNVLNFYEKLDTLCTYGFINTKIYFVNDGSKDRTQELVNQILEKEKTVTTTVSNIALASTQQLSVNTRKAGTYIEGIKSIRADILVFVDADDSFLIDDIAKMINIIREGYYDMVVGTKDLTAENRPPIRRLMSFVKRLMTKSLLPVGVYDSQTGLKAMNGISAKYILPHLNVSTGLAIDLEIMNIAKKYRFRTLQMPVQCIDQEGSHINIVKDSLQFITNIYKIRKRNKSIKIDKSVL